MTILPNTALSISSTSHLLITQKKVKRTTRIRIYVSPSFHVHHSTNHQVPKKCLSSKHSS